MLNQENWIVSKKSQIIHYSQTRPKCSRFGFFQINTKPTPLSCTHQYRWTNLRSSVRLGDLHRRKVIKFSRACEKLRIGAFRAIWTASKKPCISNTKLEKMGIFLWSWEYQLNWKESLMTHNNAFLYFNQNVYRILGIVPVWYVYHILD